MNNYIKNTTEIRCLNRWLMTGWAILAAALILAYGVKGLILGGEEVKYALFVIASIVVSYGLAIIIYRKNKESEKLGYVFAISHCVATACVMLQSYTPLTMLYMIPIMYIVIAFNKPRLSLITAITYGTTSVVMGINQQYIMKAWDMSFDVAVIYFLISIGIAIYFIISSRYAQKFSQQKINIAEHQKSVIAEVVAESTKKSKFVESETKNTAEQLNVVVNVVDGIRAAMAETTSGMASARVTIDEQMNAVSSISNQTDAVVEEVERIKDAVGVSNQTFDQADTLVQNLLLSSHEVASSAESALKTVSDLDKIVKNVTTVVGIISGITKQTKLLALNASIESARAGEAGKGFVVVATEIGKLASQTANATENITSMTSELANSFQDVQTAVQSLAQNGKQQVKTIDCVSNEFLICKEQLNTITSATEKQIVATKELNQNCKGLAESIQDLSATDEEVFACATSTADYADNAGAAVTEVAKNMDNINEAIHDLLQTLNK